MTIATKEQERKALEQIKTLVKSLGENSYLAAAFDGAFELAERNIEDDAAYSTRYYIDQAMKTADAEQREKEVKEELAETTDSLANVKKAHQVTIENLNTTAERASKYAYEIDDVKAALKAKEAEIVTLKAKLYDYMTIPA